MRQWYTIRSKPRKEASSAAQLAKVGIEVYLPQMRVHKGRDEAPTVQPLFPGYFFSRLDPQKGEMRLASYTRGVLYILGYDGQPYPVPHTLILSIQERLAQHKGRAPVADFRAGEKVIITRGPFSDVEAIFDCQLSASGRVRVLVRMLERLCRAEVHADQLRRTGKAAVSA